LPLQKKHLTIALSTELLDYNSPLWQPAMGNTTHVEYRNSWNCYKGWEVSL